MFPTIKRQSVFDSSRLSEIYFLQFDCIPVFISLLVLVDLFTRKMIINKFKTKNLLIYFLAYKQARTIRLY